MNIAVNIEAPEASDGQCVVPSEQACICNETQQNLRARLGSRKTGLSPPPHPPVFWYWPFQCGTSVVIPYYYLFCCPYLLWFAYYVSDVF